MMWKPNSVRTTSEIAPGRRRNATSSNSFTITPRRNQPSTPPCSRDTLSAEYFFATSAKVAPPFFRSATTSDSASCSARTLAAESGFGTITIWRKEMAAGRLACCSRFDSQNARISASDGAIGRSFPLCLSPSINRCCWIARRCWSASQRRHSSSDTNPAARSCAWKTGIEVNCLRTFWTVCSTASCTSWSVTLIVVSRSACWTSSSSSTICERIWRRAASFPAESSGTFTPCDCARTSCSSTCDARIGLVPTTATTRSTGRSVAARPCAAARGAERERAASAATTTVRTSARMSVRRLAAAALRRDRRRARRPFQTRGGGPVRRRVRGPDGLRALHCARDSRLVERPRLALAQRARQEGRDRDEGRAALGDRLVHIAVDVRHGQLHPRGGGRGGVLEQLGRHPEHALETRQARVVLGAQLSPVARVELNAGLVHLDEQHFALRQHLEELLQLGVARRGDPAHVVRVERQQPPRQVLHLERASAIRDQRPVVGPGGHDLRHRLAHQRRCAGSDLELPLFREAVQVQGVELGGARVLEIGAERVPHLGERWPADDVEAERRPDHGSHRARWERPRGAVERGDELPAWRGRQIATPRLGSRVLRVAPGELREVEPTLRSGLHQDRGGLLLLLLLHHRHGALRNPDEDVLEQPHGAGLERRIRLDGRELAARRDQPVVIALPLELCHHRPLCGEHQCRIVQVAPAAELRREL